MGGIRIVVKPAIRCKRVLYPISTCVEAKLRLKLLVSKIKSCAPDTETLSFNLSHDGPHEIMCHGLVEADINGHFPLGDKAPDHHELEFSRWFVHKFVRLKQKKID